MLGVKLSQILHISTITSMTCSLNESYFWNDSCIKTISCPQKLSTVAYILCKIDCRAISYSNHCRLQWRNMASWTFVNIDLRNDLLPDGTKPLHEPTLTYHQWCPVEFTWGQFRRKCSTYVFFIWIPKLQIYDCSRISQGPTNKV